MQMMKVKLYMLFNIFSHFFSFEKLSVVIGKQKVAYVLNSFEGEGVDYLSRGLFQL